VVALGEHQNLRRAPIEAAFFLKPVLENNGMVQIKLGESLRSLF
jgi:hypothetical protein